MTRTIISFFCLAFVISGLFSCGKSCEDLNVPYVAVEETEVPLTYSIGKSTWKRIDGMSLLDVLGKLHSETEVTNTSEKGGTFKLVERYETTQDNEILFEDDKYINAGETVTFIFERELPPYVTIKDNKIQSKVYPSSIKIKKEITKFRKCNTCDADCETLTNEYYKGPVPTEVDSTTWVFYDNSVSAKFKKATKTL